MYDNFSTLEGCRYGDFRPGGNGVNDLYHDGHRKIQDQFDSVKLADRLNEVIVHDELTDEDLSFIETKDVFFIVQLVRRGGPLSPTKAEI